MMHRSRPDPTLMLLAFLAALLMITGALLLSVLQRNRPSIPEGKRTAETQRTPRGMEPQMNADGRRWRVGVGVLGC
jgi:hypothetical protein